MSFFDRLQSASESDFTCVDNEFLTRRHTNNVRDQEYKIAIIQTFYFLDTKFIVQTHWSNGNINFKSPVERSFDLKKFMNEFPTLSSVMVREQPIDYTPPRDRVFDNEEDFEYSESVCDDVQTMIEPDFIPMEMDSASYKTTNIPM
jgi:hypothetical protein